MDNAQKPVQKKKTMKKKPRKKVQHRVDINTVQFVFIRGKQLDNVRYRFAKGISYSNIEWLDCMEFARLTNAQVAALQPEGWIKEGLVDIRTYPFKYMKPHFTNRMQFWRGLTLANAEKLDKQRRVRFFAHKLGWHRETKEEKNSSAVRYCKYTHALRYAVKHNHVEQEAFDSDDDFLYNFLRKFRQIELGFEAAKKEEGRHNFYPCVYVVQLCLGQTFSVPWRHTEIATKIAKARTVGKALLAEFEQREQHTKQNIDCWKLLFGKRYQPVAVRARVAHCLFLAHTPKASRYVQLRAQARSRARTRKKPKKEVE